ncbi:MAG: alpha-1,6-mannosyltransferase [Saprospiraceae bacterium]
MIDLPIENKTIYSVLSAVVLSVATLYISFIPKQSDFCEIVFACGIAFAGYSYLSFFSNIKTCHVLGLGLIVRIGCIFAFPNLSDDIYRFVWDGQLSAQGMNPYGYLPSGIISDMEGLYWKELFAKMNSPDYYTIYPPFTQLIFYISTFAGEHIWWSAFIIKICFLVAELLTFIGIVRLLDNLKKNTSLAAIYFLNPLIMVEGIGNLHFEIIMVSFLVWAIYFTFIKKKIALGSLLFVLSIASKLLPLMFLPYFLFKLNGIKRLKFFTYGLVFLLVSFLPIILGLDFINFGSSIDLYFQKFEFNAGIYYLLRYLGKLWSGYNLIHYLGPLLGVTAVLLILKKAYSTNENSLQQFLDFAFFGFCSYLLLATTVHPWYLIIPVMLSVFVRFRFAVIWSFLIMLSYINYSYDFYFENLWVVGLEYVLVFGMIGFEQIYSRSSAIRTKK